MLRTLTLLTALVATPLLAEDMITYETTDSFDDVAFGVESAILDRGLVIDNTSHVGEMLARTGADVGSDKQVFINADVYSFCSASLSRKVMEADPMNLRFCPYNIFVTVLPSDPETTIVGFRSFPEGAMQEVQSLLDDIAREAVGD